MTLLPLAGACSPAQRRADVRLPLSLCGSASPASDAVALADPAYRLVAEPGVAEFDEGGRRTAIWGYRDLGGHRSTHARSTHAYSDPPASHPGPLIRARQGELLPVTVDNGLPVPTTIHWHGLRLHNAMDGVPEVTQAVIAPGQRFGYRLLCRDAGTFWYHPHYATHEQLVRGLAGPVIVDEEQPPVVDHDLVWTLSDWLLDTSGALRGDFDDLRDVSHAGRIGNRVTIDGRAAMFREAGDPQPMPVTTGARVRLRLINAASARVFALRLSADTHFEPMVAALDGHPCTLHGPDVDGLVLGPGQRADLLFDMPPGRVRIEDLREPRRAYLLRELTAQGPRQAARVPIAPLPTNPWLAPDPRDAHEVTVLFEGGARGLLRQARVGDETVSPQTMADRWNLAWTINGVAARDGDHPRIARVSCGQTVVLRMRNDTRWAHPIHLHGHHFEVLAVDGRAPAVRMVRDTLMMEPMSSADLAFVADNPGQWMFHCHVLQHQAGGMMAMIDVQ
jgi:FtsP/CotA-like multicopper oxidase with cupredoxin domain